MSEFIQLPSPLLDIQVTFIFIVIAAISILDIKFLSLLVIPFIWAAPFYGISNAIFAKYLMERYEHSLAEVPEICESEITVTETD